MLGHVAKSFKERFRIVSSRQACDSCVSIYIPMYDPSMAVLGVLNPNPTSLYHLRPPFPTLVDLAFDLLLTKM